MGGNVLLGIFESFLRFIFGDMVFRVVLMGRVVF